MSRARRLWTGWRGEMMQHNLRGVSSLQEALKPRNMPKSLTKENWEWLVVEHYMDLDFQMKSAINSEDSVDLLALVAGRFGMSSMKTWATRMERSRTLRRFLKPRERKGMGVWKRKMQLYMYS